jgi:membrane protein YdbS with pleckstrin-like domain
MILRPNRQFILLKAMNIFIVSLALLALYVIIHSIRYLDAFSPYNAYVATGALLGMIIAFLHGNYIYIAFHFLQYAVHRDSIEIKSGIFLKEIFHITAYSTRKKEIQQYFWMKWINVCNVRVLQGNRWITLYGLGPEERKYLGIAV